MADTTDCSYNSNCTVVIDPATEKTMTDFFWIIFIGLGVLMLLPLLYIVFRCDTIRQMWADRQGAETREERRDQREQTRRAKSASIYGSVV